MEAIQQQQQQQQLIGANGDVRLEGYLVKKAMKSGRSWKRRYFVLDGTTLWYFRGPHDAKAKGEIAITSNTFVKESHYKPNSLELSTNRQVLIICAESLQTQQQWLRALERSINLARLEKDKAGNKGLGAGSSTSGGNNAVTKKYDYDDNSSNQGESFHEEESKTSSSSGGFSRAGSLFKRFKSKRRNSTSSTGADSLTSMGSSSKLTRAGSTMSDAMEVESHSEEPPIAPSEGGLGDQKQPIGMTATAATTKSSGSASAPNFKPRKTHKFSTPATTFEVDTRYSFIRPIGTGAYGVVVSANDKLNREKVAIKKVTRAFEDLVDAKRILREIKLLRHFDHENIIHIKDLLPPRGYNDFEDIYIVSELMETDLHRVIYSKQKLSEDHIQYFVYQTLRALKYIHSANVIHRDLKPSNLLLNSNCDLKICDFGLARGLEDTKLELTEYVVTRWYRAPEIMLACREYTKAIDVWALGCIFAELLARKPLFPGEDYIHQLQLITDILGTPSEADMQFIKSEKAKRFMRNQPLRCKRRMSQMYPKASAECIDLLEQMLQFNPDKRITVDDALRHPYLATLHQPDDEPVCDRIFLFDDNKPDDQLRKRDIQDQILREVLHFHPEEKEKLEFEAKNSKNSSVYFQ